METLPKHYLDCHAIYFDMVYKYLKSYFELMGRVTFFMDP